MPKEGQGKSGVRNVLGGRLQTCSHEPKTGFIAMGVVTLGQTILEDISFALC